MAQPYKAAEDATECLFTQSSGRKNARHFAFLLSQSPEEEVSPTGGLRDQNLNFGGGRGFEPEFEEQENVAPNRLTFMQKIQKIQDKFRSSDLVQKINEDIESSKLVTPRHRTSNRLSIQERAEQIKSRMRQTTASQIQEFKMNAQRRASESRCNLENKDQAIFLLAHRIQRSQYKIKKQAFGCVKKNCSNGASI